MEIEYFSIAWLDENEELPGHEIGTKTWVKLIAHWVSSITPNFGLGYELFPMLLDLPNGKKIEATFNWNLGGKF